MSDFKTSIAEDEGDRRVDSATDPLASAFPRRSTDTQTSRDRTEEELSLWIARPAIVLKLQALSGALGDPLRSPPSETTVESVKEPKVPRRISLGLLVGRDGVATLWTTDNQRRALGRMAALERVMFSVKDFLSASKIDGQLASSYSAYENLHSSSDQSARSDLPMIWQQLLNAAIYRSLLEAVFDMAGVVRVVVSTQHSIPARAAIAAAGRLGIPSIYVPHAPVALNRFYSDLPTDVAGVWGPYEWEHYASLGADVGRVKVVGSAMHDLARDARHTPALSRQSPQVLVAPSAWSDARLSEFISLCSSAIRVPFAIAPHPRNPIELIRAVAPRRANVLSGPTAAHLRSFAALVQCNSGVALEGLLAPVPVVNFNPFGLQPNYPMIRSPHVPEVRTKGALRSILAKVLSVASDPLRGPAQDWGRGWCEFSGADAESRLRDLVNSAERHDTPVLDGWAYA